MRCGKRASHVSLQAGTSGYAKRAQVRKRSSAQFPSMEMELSLKESVSLEGLLMAHLRRNGLVGFST